MRGTLASFLVTLFLIQPTQTLCAPRLAIYAGGGGNIAVGDLGERSEVGFHGKLGIGLAIVDQPRGGVELIGHTMYSRFPTDVDTEGDFSLVTAGLDLKMNYEQENGSVLYMILGGGYANAGRDSYTSKRTVLTASGPTVIETPIEKRRENDFYATAGIGAALNGNSRLKPFLEIRFTDISGSYIRDYRFFTASIGVKIS